MQYYPFAVKLDICIGSCNTLNNLSNKVCVPNETKDLNLRMFNVITGINELKRLTKDISCKCKCKFDSRKCNSDQKWNNDKCRCECKRHNIFGEDHILNAATCSYKDEKYLANIMDDSVITCDEIIDVEAKSYNEETKAIQKNFNEKK